MLNPALPMNPHRNRGATRRVVAAVLLALLLGQWTVLVHAINHAGTATPAALSADSDQAWGHQSGTSACHLVDHLLAGQAPGGEPASAAFVPPSAIEVAVPATPICPGPASRAYEARGPPRA